MHRNFCRFGLVVVAAVSQGPFAYGQSAAEEIVVTATRREEEAGKVALSLAAFDTRALAEMGAVELADVAREVPGLHVMPGATVGGGNAISIRGISSQAGASTVGIYLDDTPLQARSNAWTQNFEPALFDLERIEVLRGPQGTLFGASSEGGTIRYLSRQPSLSGRSGVFQAGVAINSRDALGFEAGAALGAPLVPEKAGFRVSAFARRDGGYVDRVDPFTGGAVNGQVNGRRSAGTTVAVLLAPVDPLQITASVTYQRRRADDEGLTWSSLGGGRTGEFASTPLADSIVIPVVKIKYAFGGVDVVAVTSYLDRRLARIDDYTLVTSDTIFKTIFPAAPNQNYQSPQRTYSTQRNISQEVRASSSDNGAPIRWTIGFFFEEARQSLTEDITGMNLAAPPRGFFYLPGNLVYSKNQLETERQYAGFGEINWRPFERLTLTAGLRVSREDDRFRYFASGVVNGPTPSLLPGMGHAETVTNPKAVVSYQLTPDHLLYASAARGDRPGGANRPVPASRCALDLASLGGVPPRTYGTDSTWSYEVGSKGRFFDRRLAIDASAFWIAWSDIQQTLLMTNCGFSYTGNLGSAVSRGVDLAARFQLLEHLHLGAEAGYTHATLSGDVRGTSNAVTGAAPVLATRGSFIQFVPEWTAAMNAAYDFALPGSITAALRADFQYSGSYRRTPGPGSVLYQPLTFSGAAYHLVNLRMEMERDGWEAAVFANNLFDARPITFKELPDPISRRVVFETTLPPRTLGASLTYRFGG